MNIWYLYIVRCKDGALYTGITICVKDRVAKHNARKGARSVIAHGIPVVLVYQEKVGSYGDALRREAAIKKFTKTKKEALIASWKMVEEEGV